MLLQKCRVQERPPGPPRRTTPASQPSCHRLPHPPRKWPSRSGFPRPTLGHLTTFWHCAPWPSNAPVDGLTKPAPWAPPLGPRETPPIVLRWFWSQGCVRATPWCRSPKHHLHPLAPTGVQRTQKWHAPTFRPRASPTCAPRDVVQQDVWQWPGRANRIETRLRSPSKGTLALPSFHEQSSHRWRCRTIGRRTHACTAGKIWRRARHPVGHTARATSPS